MWTHRNPVECIASACSLYEFAMNMTFESSTVNKIDLGKAVVKYSKLALEKALNYLKSSTIKIIHINYSDNVD